MQAIASTVEAQLSRIDAFLERTKGAFAALGAGALVGFGLEEIADKINAAIEATAGLENLAARTGATVEGLSALAAVARLSGTDTEQLATGLTKLDKSISALAADTPKAVAAFAAIGLSAKDFVGLSADQAFAKVAVAMSGYADGVEKTAAAQLIFGKAGAALIPVLRDTAEAGDLVATTTARQAHEAEEYEKTLRRLTLATDSVFRAIGAQIVPAFDAFARAMLQTTTSADGLNASIKTMAADGSIRSWAEESAIAVAHVVDAFDGLWRVVKATGTLLGAFAASVAHGFKLSATEGLGADIDAIFQKQTFADKVRAQIEAAHKRDAEPLPPPKPTIDLGAATAGGDQKALLDQALKTEQAFISAENDLLKQRDEQLKRLYDDNRLSIHDYFAGLQSDQEKHITEVSNAYDREIAAVENFILHAETKKEQDAGNLRVLELQAQQSRAIQAEGAALAKITDEQARATEAYTAKVSALNVQLLIQQGRLAEAARLQAEDTDRKFKQRAALEPGGAGIVAEIDASERYKTALGGINEKKDEAALIEERLATTIGRVNLSVSTGQISELEGLARTDAARRAEIDQLEKIADDQIRIAQTVNDNGRSLAAAEAFKLKIDQLAASTDSLAKKFTDMEQSAFGTELDKVIQRTESVTQAFKNMFASIFSQLSQLASKNIAQQLFGGASGGGGGGGGGLGSLISSLGLGDLAAGGSYGSFSDALAGIFGGGFAEGTPYVPRDMLARVHEGERIVPADENNSYSGATFGGSTTVHVHMPAGVEITRQSATLVGAAAARQVSIASRRNN